MLALSSEPVVQKQASNWHGEWPVTNLSGCLPGVPAARARADDDDDDETI